MLNLITIVLLLSWSVRSSLQDPAALTENTKFVTLDLPDVPHARPALGTSLPFSYPVGCDPTVKRTVEPFCVNGTMDIGNLWVVNLDLNLFDVVDPTKSVMMGMKATLDNGKSKALFVRTRGCATLLKQTIVIFVLDGLVIACTEGGDDGTYEPSLPGYAANITVSGQLKMTSGIKTVMDYNYSLPGHAFAGANFDLGMKASVFNSTGKPRGSGVNATFTVTLNTTGHSLFDWRIFAGLHTKSWVYPLPPLPADINIVDVKMTLKPPPTLLARRALITP